MEKLIGKNKAYPNNAHANETPYQNNFSLHSNQYLPVVRYSLQNVELKLSLWDFVKKLYRGFLANTTAKLHRPKGVPVTGRTGKKECF
jgi:hypothetical protein